MSEPALTFASQVEWDTWLEARGRTSPGVRLRIVKKAVTRAGRIARFVEMLVRGETLQP